MTSSLAATGPGTFAGTVSVGGGFASGGITPQGGAGNPAAQLGLFNVTDFGARAGDQNNDLSAAVARAAAVAAALGGGEIVIPAGLFWTKNPVLVPDFCRLSGRANRASVIKAHATFPINTGVVQIVGASGKVYDGQVEQLCIDCNDIAGSIGVYSQDAEEESGVFDCLIQNFRDVGVKYVNDASATHLERCELYGSSLGFNGGALYDTVTNYSRVQDVTVGNIQGPAGVQGSYGVRVLNCEVLIGGLHIEEVVDGILWDTGSSGSARGVFAHSTVTNAVHMSATQTGGLAILDVILNGATTAIKDDANVKTLASAAVPFYFVMLGSGGASGKTVFHSETTVGAKIAAPLELGLSFGVGVAPSGTKGRADFANGANQLYVDPLNLRIGSASAHDWDLARGASSVATVTSSAVQPKVDTAMDLGQATLRWRDGFLRRLLTSINTVTDGSTVTPDLSLGNDQVHSRAAGTAWTLANPINPPTNIGQVWRYTLRNTSGGVIAIPSLGAAYKLPAFVMPATGQSRTYEFRWDGTNHVLVNQLATDVPN